MDSPLGYYVGNALEVIEAMEVLKGNAKGRLLDLCVKLSTEVVSKALNLETSVAETRVLKALSSGKALETFTKMVEFQGGDPHIVEDYTRLGKAKYSYEVKAHTSGTIQKVACEEVGLVSLALGAGRRTKSDPVDYSAGVKFAHHLGDYVSVGETVATLYSSTLTDFSATADRLSNAVVLN
jgi:pyrimidine-nucleoside phosphorylase